eukprot:GFUD01012421.1.p1 GENE.GFUD01012421.1~~GFUD01012421.1.p1  ORF type:complete len:195 (+),score=61.79 GFUD01012421.1:81-587(+)
MSAISCGVLTTHGVLKDENGFILPRKITNPCLESLPVREMQREMRWNSDKGINVLNSKTELEKVLAKQRRASEQKSREAENEVEDEFKKMITERAKRLKKLEQEEGLPAPPTTQHNLTQCQAVKVKKISQTPKKSVVISGGEKSVMEQESEFARVFAQLRGENRELVF